MENYASAAIRHWDNVAFLGQAGRWQEAAYLAGYVAECSLKCLLQTSDLSNVRPLGHDLAVLSGDAMELALLLAPATARYRVEALSPGGDGVSGWRSEQRYDVTDPAREPEFRQMAQQAETIARSILIDMALDGLLDGLLSEVPQ